MATTGALALGLVIGWLTALVRPRMAGPMRVVLASIIFLSATWSGAALLAWYYVDGRAVLFAAFGLAAGLGLATRLLRRSPSALP